jgi:hypothetical protein
MMHARSFASACSSVIRGMMIACTPNKHHIASMNVISSSSG